MWRTRFVLELVVLYVALVHSWDVAVSHEDLLEFFTDETKTHTVRFNSHKLGALAYDEVHNMILFVDKQNDNDAICGYDISSEVNHCFIERNGRNIHGLAFDPATELLFFSDTNERSIHWISLQSGSNINGNLLIKLDHGIPTDIAVDSCRGFVYWINTNRTTPIIERARFNGSEREVMRDSNSLSINITLKLEPHSLTIDQQTQRMYWIEPWTSSQSRVVYTDLNGNNKAILCYITFNDEQFNNPSSNTLTVSKTSLFRVHWCSDCEMKVSIFSKKTFMRSTYLVGLDIKNVTVGVVANYKIKERIQGINNCEALTCLEREISDGMFCVHGVKVFGQSICKCIPGYIGERCDLSVCENYCLQGNCSVNEKGQPKCRCNAGYSGDRCEVEACHGFCLNNGVCSLNDEDEPSCECVDRYQGSRCEAVQNDISTSTSTTTQSAGSKLSLADLRKQIGGDLLQ